MSGRRLQLKAVPALRVDLRTIVPLVLAAMSDAEIEHLPLGYGNAKVALGEFFRLLPEAGDALVFEGDLSRFDHVGWQMAGGRLVVEGSVGDHAGGCMTAGEVVIAGSAGALAACEMAGGSLTVAGNVGDFAASTLPGSMDGMRGGCLIVKGDAGQRFGDRMRRGSALVFGRVGDFVASRMVAGTIGVGGGCGIHPGYGMRRGSVVFADASIRLDTAGRFVPALADADVFWQLLARDLARHGGPFEGLASRRIERHLGDVTASGKGELIFAS